MKQRNRNRRSRLKLRFYFACAASGLTLSVYCAASPQVEADTPAVTDFAPGPTKSLTQVSQPLHALFWTRGKNGSQTMMEKPIYDDAISGFAGDHPAWHLDTELSWFVGMPVYERDIVLRLRTPSDNQEMV